MPQKIKIPENELVKKLKAKEEEAFRILYDNYSSALYGIILRIVKEEEIANDVMQDSFIKIWKNIAAYDSTKGKLFTWIINIARNTALDEIRSLQFRHSVQNQKIDDSVHMIDLNKNVKTKEDHIGLKETITSLKPEHEVIVNLLYFKGYTQEEVSKELQIPLGTVKTRARAAISKLRELFNLNIL